VLRRALQGLSVVLAAGLCAGVVVQSLSLRRSQRELDRLRARVDQLEARASDGEAAADALVAEMRARTRIAERQPGPLAAAVTAPAHPGAAPAIDEAALERLVDRRIEKKLEASPKAGAPGGGERKVPLHDLAKELAIDPRAQERVEEIANAAKKEIFDVARTPRADGTSLADDLVAAVLKGDEKGARQVFGKLFTDKVPGTDSTYVAVVTGIQDKANRGLEQTLGPDGYARYRHMSLRPENIETGYDPFGEYVKQHFKK
jgi:hypothetical protein